MRSSDAKSAPASSRATRSKLALAIVAVLLLATFSPVNWFRGWLPRGSSPASSLGEWVDRREELLQLRRQNLFSGPKAKAIDALLSADGTVETVVIGFPTEEEWEHIAREKQGGGTTSASWQVDDLSYYPPAPTATTAAEPVQAARSNPPIAD
jgi:hypothetical protein